MSGKTKRMRRVEQLQALHEELRGAPAAPEEGDLRVWHVPQLPGEAFRVPVEGFAQAVLVLRVLADYDAHQLAHGVKPDYCNAQGLEVYEGGEWVEWVDESGEDVTSHLRGE